MRIKEAFGINDAFLQYLTQFNLIIPDDCQLRTTVFQKCVKLNTKIDSEVSARTIGTVAGHTTAVVGSLTRKVHQLENLFRVQT
jgi:hypothetical protein